MKIRVEKDYIDKISRRNISKGEEYEVSDERGAELIAAGYASEIKTGRGRGPWQSQESPTDQE